MRLRLFIGGHHAPGDYAFRFDDVLQFGRVGSALRHRLPSMTARR